MTHQNHLIDRLIKTALDDPDRLFAEQPGKPDMTYGQLFDLAARMAHRLQALGVAPGDRIAAQVSKSRETIALYLAIVMAGSVFLPLNTAYTASELAYFLTDAEPAVMVCDPKDKDTIGALTGNAALLTLDADAGGTLMDLSAAAPMSPVTRGADDLAAILYTSGTTGRSKGAMLSHANLAANSETLRDLWQFTDRDVLIHALPVYHTHGLFVATNVALLAGASLIFLPKFDADAVIAALPRATSMMGVPTFYTRLLDHPGLTREACGTMRLFVSGSAPLLASTHTAWEARTGHRILERYGMTETNMSTSNPYDGERRPGTVGHPLPGVELRIMDGARQAAPGQIGVIEVRGPNVFQGYWRMPDKTAEELRPDGWFITGDHAVQDADGYVTIVGRAKDMIITGGLNVYPKELETLIDKLDGVQESAVIGVPHPDFGEAVVAIIAVEGAEGTVTEAGILAALQDRLARFKQPKSVCVVAALPRNTMGKVQKKALRETYADLFTGA